MENTDEMLNKAIRERDMSQIRQILSVFITGDQSF
jgi:ribosomal protein L21E